ncbi:WD repeat protein [Ophiocordyceps camponoti-floridani]|uniref:WD repeat protein n=1 Tax=Ophiocordyceps camponoti-floridani TaxID=2030778 RepID=A0A8H4QA58_9HYPO|nr:WD repeat protein [Ophiocordyceps camponoti-floridani]
MSSGSLCLQHGQVPITALHLWTSPRSGVEYIVVGSGAELSVYDALPSPSPSLSGPRHRLRVWPDAGQPVHGLTVWDARRLLVWGGTCVCVVDLTSLEDEEDKQGLRLLASGSAPDWVHDGDKRAIVTAGNEVMSLTWVEEHDQVHDAMTISFGPATASPERTMLYAARLTRTGPSSILVAAGTVFGDILVWTCVFADDGLAATASPCRRLTGHEGSVYGLDFSSPLSRPDGTTIRLLASCSDDRTVRVWDVSGSKEGLDTPAWTETGFKPAADSTSGLVAAAMGHASRIWAVRFAITEHDMFVYSFGEDATAQSWRLTLPAPGSSAVGRLDHDRTVAQHSGKHIWAGAVLARRDGSIMVATGGADSQICLIEAASGTDGLVTVDVPDMLRLAQDGGDSISRYDFLREHEILVTTVHGRLFVGDLHVSGQWSWDELAVDDDVAAELKLVYAVRAVGKDAIVLGTTAGSLFCFRNPPGRLTRVAKVPGKIMDVSCVASSESESSVEMLVHLHGSPDSRYLSLDPLTGRVLRHEHITGLDARFVIVSAARIDGVLLLGSRRGWLCLLAREGDEWRPKLNMATRSRDAITAMVVLPRSDATATPHFVATSRDGHYRIYRLEADDCPLLHETSLPLGPMIEGTWFTPGPSPELVLYGFRGKHFVVWNETRREEVVTVDCGGAHRTFRLWRRDSEPWRCRFAFTRTSRLCIYSQTRAALRSVKGGTHGREIRALSSNGRCIATGAEDTTIRFWDPGDRQMRHLATVKAHVSGIQRLRWFGHERLLSSGGNEELLVWRVRRLVGTSYQGLAVVRESQLRATSDLRILDLDVGGWDVGEGVTAVTLALSNSTLRTYGYYASTGCFEPVAEGLYTGACLTQTRHLGPRGDRLWAATASTDGHVALWETAAAAGEDGAWRLAQVTRLHQSSIKCLDMGGRSTGGYRIVTGGDDNALGVIEVATVDGGYVIQWRGIVEAGAHAAAINGVAMDSEDDEGDSLVVTASNDQRLRAWRLKGRTMELLASSNSAVADAGDMMLIGSKKRIVVVAGVGIEIWGCDA